MNAASPTGSSSKLLRAAGAIESFDRASTSRVDQKFMTKIKKGENHIKEMLKMKEPPGMCMKTKVLMTQCPIIKTTC
jgi:hypothetical protein